jgi:hypothetical protein
MTEVPTTIVIEGVEEVGSLAAGGLSERTRQGRARAHIVDDASTTAIRAGVTAAERARFGLYSVAANARNGEAVRHGLLASLATSPGDIPHV